MSVDDSLVRQARLDRIEWEHLEDVITDLRDTVEKKIAYELEYKYDLTNKVGGGDLSNGEQTVPEGLAEGFEHGNLGNKCWNWCYHHSITGVGYTILSRLAAFRTIEVRKFLNQPVTQIGDSRLTLVAERVLEEQFDSGPKQALIVAYHEECERIDEVIEILFNLSSPYSVIEPDSNLFCDVVETLDHKLEDITPHGEQDIVLEVV